MTMTTEPSGAANAAPKEDRIVKTQTNNVAVPVKEEKPSVDNITIKEPEKPVEPAVEITEETEEAATSQDSQPEAPKKSKGVQKRLDELTRSIYEKDFANQQLQRQLAELQRKPDFNAPLGDPPKLESYSTIEDYNKAVIDYGRKLGAQETQRQYQMQQADQERIRLMATVKQRLDATAIKHPDFYQTVAPLGPMVDQNQALQHYMAQRESAPEVLYHLAKNQPGKLYEIAQMHPVNAVRELTRIEDRLSNPPPVKTTQAPAPMTPVGSSQKAPYSADSSSYEEFKKRRNEEERKRKG